MCRNFTRTGFEVCAYTSASHKKEKFISHDKLICVIRIVMRIIFVVQCHPQNILNIKLFQNYSISHFTFCTCIVYLDTWSPCNCTLSKLYVCITVKGELKWKKYFVDNVIQSYNAQNNSFYNSLILYLCRNCDDVIFSQCHQGNPKTHYSRCSN